MSDQSTPEIDLLEAEAFPNDPNDSLWSRFTESERDWRCECGDLNRWHESCCYRCGAGRTEEEDAVPDFPNELVEAVKAELQNAGFHATDEDARYVARRLLPLIERRRTREIVEALRKDAAAMSADNAHPAFCDGIENAADFIERFLNGEESDA